MLGALHMFRRSFREFGQWTETCFKLSQRMKNSKVHRKIFKLKFIRLYFIFEKRVSVVRFFVFFYFKIRIFCLLVLSYRRKTLKPETMKTLCMHACFIVKLIARRLCKVTHNEIVQTLKVKRCFKAYYQLSVFINDF